MVDSLPPVAIRIARPYATEDQLLENELETLTRTSITLLGAPPRPNGLVLRFELLLSGGLVLVRGEGRVVGYKPDAYYGLGGLMLRFTRLDTRSKGVVDRAAAMRERRRPSFAGALGEVPSLPLRPIDVENPAVSPIPNEVPVRTPERSEGADYHLTSRTPGRSEGADEKPRDYERASARDVPQNITSSVDRDALLERLRARSKALHEDVVKKIFERGR